MPIRFVVKASQPKDASFSVLHRALVRHRLLLQFYCRGRIPC
jgi:hypothetical protein